MFGMEMRTVYLFPAVQKEIGGDKWGYIDAKGKWVLHPIYDHAGDFQDNGLAIVQLLDKSGVIDAKGYFIVKPKYDSINPFSEGRATVIDRHGFKVIDESGREITGRTYSYIGDYKEGRALIAGTDSVGEDAYGYLNKYGKEVIPLSFEVASDFSAGKAVVQMKDGSYCLIDLTGKVLKKYPYAFAAHYGEGLLVFQKNKGGKFGYIDEQGNIVIEPKFSAAQEFINGLAIVNMAEKHENSFGIINLKGQFVLKPNYTNLLYLGENRFAIGKDLDPTSPCIRSIYGLADSDGHILTGFIFHDVGMFHEGLALVSNDKHTFFINKSGKRVEHLPLVSGSGTLSFEKTLIKGEIDNRLLYFKNNGEMVWQQNRLISVDSEYAVMEHKYRPNKDYLVYYPQMSEEGDMAGVNRQLKELSGMKPVPEGKQLDSNYMGDFAVPFFKKNLLVIEIEGYDYPFCGAHGMPVRKYAHINLKTGELYQLKDLFKQGSPYVKVLSEIIKDQIKSNENCSDLFPEKYHEIQSDQPFFISEAGLNIYFHPYEIAPFAAGFQTFTISFADLRDILNLTCGFWRAFH